MWARIIRDLRLSKKRLKERIIELLILNYSDMAKTVFSCVGASMNKMGIYYDLFITLPQTAAYRNGDLSVWRIRKDLFIYCYKNIVIIELMNMDRAFVDSLTKPERVKTDYAEFIARERMSNAEQYAKEYGFKLENV